MKSDGLRGRPMIMRRVIIEIIVGLRPRSAIAATKGSEPEAVDYLRSMWTPALSSRERMGASVAHQ
jgi:hypothetical protein